MTPPVRDIIWLPASKPTAKQIIAHVAQRRGLTVEDLTGPGKVKRVAHARHEAMWEIRQRTTLSFPQIASRLNRKDHTTALHGVRAHEARLLAKQGAA